MARRREPRSRRVGKWGHWSMAWGWVRSTRRAIRKRRTEADQANKRWYRKHGTPY